MTGFAPLDRVEPTRLFAVHGPMPRDPAKAGSLAILLAEDDESVRSALIDLLQSSGHRVVPAKNGEDALGAWRRGSIDLVLTDILMPRKDGLEFIEEVHQQQPLLPIVAMSGGGSRIEGRYCLATAKSFGATVTIPKPFSRGEILSAIEEAWLKNRPAGGNSTAAPIGP